MLPAIRIRSEKDLLPIQIHGCTEPVTGPLRLVEGTRTTSSLCVSCPTRKKEPSNAKWVHLLSTICTEWSQVTLKSLKIEHDDNYKNQECMVIKQAAGLQTAVKVLGVKDNNANIPGTWDNKNSYLK